MAIFKLTAEDAKRFAAFTGQVEQIASQFSEFDKEDAKALRHFAAEFKKKTDEFFNNERRLNIGIVGQVKAGKSSFLNTLLFNGMSVLPKASTPMTASLTKIEYADENAMEVEYYNEEDWEVIVENSEIDLDGAEYASARELVKMAKDRGIDVNGKIAEGRERIVFGSYEELEEQLKNYVGVDGQYTALVKSVVLYVNNPLFSELSIVDTPGLNDPIVSRTMRTKEFIEVCDVVFFLTPCGAFLDKSDWTLLSTQLPQKGVKRLVLVGSKLDSGIRDVLRKQDPDDPFGADPNTAESIGAAIELVRSKLTVRTLEKLKEYEKNQRDRGAGEELIRVLNGCRKPVFVSAMVRNMSGRDTVDYDAEERKVWEALSEFSDHLTDELPIIDGFAEVESLRDAVVAEKDAILLEKSVSFIPTAEEELFSMLEMFRKQSQKRLAVLTGNDRQKLVTLKEDVGKRIHTIRSEINAAIGEWAAIIDTQRAEGVRELRNAARANQKLNERTGTEIVEKSYTVKDSKWYKFWTWGRTRTKYYTYEVSYSYIAASDALDNIRRFIKDSERHIERTFTDAVSLHAMKRRFLCIVADNFDMGDIRNDVSLFRGLIENAINQITLPTIRIDCSDIVNSLAARFCGKLRDDQKDGLRNALADAINKSYKVLSDVFDASAADFKSCLLTMGEDLQKLLLDSTTTEFEGILKDLDEKDAAISRINTYLECLEKTEKEVKL